MVRLLVTNKKERGIKLSEVKQFQGYVNQSLMDAGKHKDEDYLKIMTKLFKQGHLNFEQVFRYMGTLAKNNTKKVFVDFLNKNWDIRTNLIETVDNGWITKDGELTEHCLNKLKEMGYEIESK